MPKNAQSPPLPHLVDRHSCIDCEVFGTTLGIFHFAFPTTQCWRPAWLVQPGPDQTWHSECVDTFAMSYLIVPHGTKQTCHQHCFSVKWHYVFGAVLCVHVCGMHYACTPDLALPQATPRTPCRSHVWLASTAWHQPSMA
jgi:hypothetical protein